MSVFKKVDGCFECCYTWNGFTLTLSRNFGWYLKYRDETIMTFTHRYRPDRDSMVSVQNRYVDTEDVLAKAERWARGYLTENWEAALTATRNDAKLEAILGDWE